MREIRGVKRKRRDTVVQMYEDSWYLDKFDQHECCLCGAQHEVRYLIENGRIFTRWKLDDKATAANRKRHGITVTRKPPQSRGKPKR